jgi:hypothetical protein
MCLSLVINSGTNHGEKMIIACLILSLVNILAWQLVAFRYFEDGGQEVALVKIHRAYNKKYLEYHYERVHIFEMR